MSSSTVTYDQVPPIRPGSDDVGGCAKQNATPPPDPQRSLTADDWNQVSKQIVEMAAVLPVAILGVTFNAGAPVVTVITGMGSAAKNPATYTPTDNGTGDTTISWPANTFPGRTANPMVTLNGGSGAAKSPEAVTVTNGIRVKTQDGAGAADIAFTVAIYGQ
jgi:hypothetical protein